jgi:hypothetical protein
MPSINRLYVELVFCTHFLYLVTAVKGSRLYIISDFRYLYSRQVALAQSNEPSLFLNKCTSRNLNFFLLAFKRMFNPETGILLQVNKLNSSSDLLQCN